MAEISTSDYWRRTLDGERLPVQADAPQPGYYRRKLVKNGPWVAARIWIEEERDEAGELQSEQKFFCLVDGKPVDAFEAWTWLANRPITEAEYRFMVDDAAWCREYAPHEPKANPTTPINLLTTAPVGPPQRST